MDILVVVLAFVFLWKIKYKKEINEEYLSVETCRSWRGFFALVVLLHHVSPLTDGGLFFEGFRYVGFLAVSVFFFFSGYGLQKKHITSVDYNKNFLKKRIPIIIIPYIIMIILYWGVWAMCGNIYSLKYIANSFVKGVPIVSNSWYIINILFLYLVFYFLMKVTRNQYKHMILGTTLAFILWVYFCVKMSFGVWWYYSTHLFVVGIIWATYEQKIVEFIKLYFNCVSIVLIIGFLMSFIVNYVINGHLISIILNTITAMLFTILILLFSMKVQVGNKLLDFLGKISLEIYLTHGLFIILCGNNGLAIKNDLLYAMIVLFSTIMFSFVINKLCKFLLKQYNKTCN